MPIGWGCYCCVVDEENNPIKVNRGSGYYLTKLCISSYFLSSADYGGALSSFSML